MYLSGNSSSNGELTINLALGNGSTSVANDKYVVFTNIQLEQGSTATEYEELVEKKIYCKSDNGVYEEFYKEIQTAIIDISLATGSGSASFPEGFTVENCVIVGHKDKNKYGVPFGNTQQIEVMLNGDNNNIQATGTGNFSGDAAKTQIILMKI
jgi:hypothetical protein